MVYKKIPILEASRNDLITKSKTSNKGRQRFKRRVKSKVASQVKQFNSIDMNKLFKDGILTVNVAVKGETDDYVVKMSFGGFLDLLRKEIKNDEEIDLRAITRALINGFNKDDVYIHCSCPDFCLDGSTKIKLLNGEIVSVADMLDKFNNGEEMWVYSSDEKGDFKPGKVSNVWISGYVNNLVKVTLDNDKEILTTPNHRYMLRDGSYKEAKDLCIGQSLMPMYFNYHNGYESYKKNSEATTKFYSVYKEVANSLLENEINEAKIRSGEDRISIHHKDFNKLNNYPSNLFPMGTLEHYLWHSNHVKESGSLEKFLEAGRKYWETDEARRKQAEHSKKINLSKIRNQLYKLIENGMELTEENYMSVSYAGCPRIKKYFGSIDEAVSYFNLNHKVKNVEYVVLENDVPVYDISVEDYNNFYVDAGVMLHNCYRFAYWATKNNINSGEPQNDNGKWIRNPDDRLGSGCKHILLVLSNNSWLIKVASVINNYIKYMKKYREKQYADIIYPAIYGKPYEEPAQTSMFDDDELASDEDTLDISNEFGRTSTQFKKGNTQGLRFASKNDDNVLDGQQQMDIQ